MAQTGTQPSTHITDFKGQIRVESADPTGAQVGEMYFNRLTNVLNYYDGTRWIGVPFND